MKLKIPAVLILLLSLSNQTYAHEISGQSAKNLYIALGALVEGDAPFYSLEKSADKIECSLSYRGLRYREHIDCTLIDSEAPHITIERHDINFHDPQIQNVNEGALNLFNALINVKVTQNGGNPPIQTKKVKVSCLLKSPVFPAEQEDAQNFSCNLENLP